MLLSVCTGFEMKSAWRACWTSLKWKRTCDAFSSNRRPVKTMLWLFLYVIVLSLFLLWSEVNGLECDTCGAGRMTCKHSTHALLLLCVLWITGVDPAMGRLNLTKQQVLNALFANRKPAHKTKPIVDCTCNAIIKNDDWRTPNKLMNYWKGVPVAKMY